MIKHGGVACHIFRDRLYLSRRVCLFLYHKGLSYTKGKDYRAIYHCDMQLLKVHAACYNDPTDSRTRSWLSVLPIISHTFLRDGLT